jgi:hypothetical protein
VTRIREIVPDGAARDRMLQDLSAVKVKLRAPENNVASLSPQLPADRAAEIILALAGKTSSRKQAARS